jgi:hypothetical protein
MAVGAVDVGGVLVPLTAVLAPDVEVDAVGAAVRVEGRRLRPLTVVKVSGGHGEVSRIVGVGGQRF